MELTERIFYLLNKKGQTSKDLSDYIDIKPSSISAWKNNGSFPSSKHIVSISEFLEVSVEFLLIGKDNSNQIPPMLKKDEDELLTIYKELDSRGKHKLHTIIYDELDRINNQKSSNNKEIE